MKRGQIVIICFRVDTHRRINCAADVCMSFHCKVEGEDEYAAIQKNREFFYIYLLCIVVWFECNKLNEPYQYSLFTQSVHIVRVYLYSWNISDLAFVSHFHYYYYLWHVEVRVLHLTAYTAYRRARYSSKVNDL